MNFKYIVLIAVLGLHQVAFCQKKISITIDDVPNTSRFEKDGYQSFLMSKLDSLKIPIAIFINEGFIYKTDSISKIFDLLNKWIQRGYITPGNHTFNHARYSTTGIDSFSKEIIHGESITRELAKKYNKSLKFFRFPFNDLGQDSLQHVQIDEFLKENGYINTPFTIESLDWVYNAVYEYYLGKNKMEEAKRIGEEYVVKTLEYFDFFETLSVEDYQRPINQIYLCHDNKLNADFLPKLINELKKREYKFISLEDALTDNVYAQKDYYFKKWGISWLYRWKATQKNRVAKMKQEPSTETIMELYEGIMKEKNGKG